MAEMKCPYSLGCNKRDCDKDFCQRRYRIECLYQNSLLTQQQRQFLPLRVDASGVDVAEFTRLSRIERGIERFVNEGHNLYLHSYICGNGKTSWSLRLINAYIQQIWSKSNLTCQALFISVPRYLLALKESINNYNEYAAFINKNVLDADIVVWDDIATKVGTEFELTHLLNLINTRIDAGKSNIFTSNLGKAELTAALGERLASRIYNKSIAIELQGSDKRHLGVNGGN